VRGDAKPEGSRLRIPLPKKPTKALGAATSQGGRI